MKFNCISRYGYTAYDGMNKDRDRLGSFEDFRKTRATKTLVSYGKALIVHISISKKNLFIGKSYVKNDCFTI